MQRPITQVGPGRQALATVDAGPRVVLRVHTVPTQAGGPDTVVLGVEGPAGLTELTRLDGRCLSTEVAAGTTGRMAGPFASTGALGLPSLRYAGSGEAPPKILGT